MTLYNTTVSLDSDFATAHPTDIPTGCLLPCGGDPFDIRTGLFVVDMGSAPPCTWKQERCLNSVIIAESKEEAISLLIRKKDHG